MRVFNKGDIVTIVNPGTFGIYKKLVGKPLTVIESKNRDENLTWFTGGEPTDTCFTWRLDYYNLNLENK